MYDFNQIDCITGFARGEKFCSEEEVRAYFTVESQEERFPGEDNPSQEELDQMATIVIENRWWME